MKYAGIVLIIVQLGAIYVTLSGGGFLLDLSSGVSPYDILYLFGYFTIGIIGIILLVISIRKEKKKKT